MGGRVLSVVWNCRLIPTSEMGKNGLVEWIRFNPIALDLDVSDLEAGLYLVRATNGTGCQVIRLMVE